MSTRGGLDAISSKNLTMAYNADNRRAEKDSSSGTTKFIWDLANDSYLSETDGTDTTTAVYTNEPAQFGGLISQRRGGATHYFHFDALESTRALTDATEAVTDTFRYDAWGVLLERTGSTENPFRYVGKLGYYFDEESLNYWIRIRPYRPNIGRFNSVDPRHPLLSTADYIYSHNNVPSRIDPSGMLDWQTDSGTTPPWVPWGFLDVPGPIPPGGSSPLKIIGHCGAFWWQTEWQLKSGESNGIIVQKVCVEEWNIDACTGAMCKLRMPPPALCINKKQLSNCPTSCYFEVWRAKDGKIYTQIPFHDNPKGQSNADVFAWLGCSNACADGCTHGQIVQSGEAFFIPWKIVKKNIGWFMKHFGVGTEGVARACALWSTCATDKIEKNLEKLKKGKSAPLKRIKRQWDCCDPCCDGGACCDPLCPLGTSQYQPPHK